MLVMFIVKTMMLPNEQESIKKFNEVDCFFLLIHIVERLDWAEIYKPGFSKQQ